MKLVKARIDQLPKPALDFVIAKAQGMTANHGLSEVQTFYGERSSGLHYYCTKWEAAGPIVEDMVKRGMRIYRCETNFNVVIVRMWHNAKLIREFYAESVPYATMLALAISMHGEYAEVPEELL